MLMDEISDSLLERLQKTLDKTNADEEALENIFNFSKKYFSIGSKFLYDNNDMINSTYNRVQRDREFLNVAIGVWNAENPYDVSRIELPEHELSDDLIAVRAYRLAMREINEYMGGGHFRKSTFKSLMSSVLWESHNISDSCLSGIMYLECIEYCANKLKGYGISGGDWKFLAKEWKDTTIFLNPKSTVEEGYLVKNPYLRDPKYIKRML